MLCRYKTKNSILTKKRERKKKKERKKAILYYLFKHASLPLVTFHSAAPVHGWLQSSRAFQAGAVSFILFFTSKSGHVQCQRPAWRCRERL